MGVCQGAAEVILRARLIGLKEDNKHTHTHSLLVMIVGWRAKAGDPLQYRAFHYISDDSENDAVFVHAALQDLMLKLTFGRKSEGGREDIIPPDHRA